MSETREKPILFSSPMIQAILAGKKTMTRRALKVQPTGRVLTARVETHRDGSGDCYGIGDKEVYGVLFRYESGGDWLVKCPYGTVGDLLVPLCSWAVANGYDDYKPTKLPEGIRIWTPFDGIEKPEWCGKLRPGRFMPKLFRNVLPRLENRGARVERLQSISEEDAKAEGVECCLHWNEAKSGHPTTPHTAAFNWLWKKINGPDSWGLNPWVWCVSFRCVPQPPESER